MFETLARAIDELQIPADGVALAAAFRLLDRLQAKVSAAVGEFDAAEEWNLDAATSTTAWLRHHAGMSGRDAEHPVRTARRLRRCPATSAAWRDGVWSGGQVQAIVANLDEMTVGLFA